MSWWLIKRDETFVSLNFFILFFFLLVEWNRCQKFHHSPVGGYEKKSIHCLLSNRWAISWIFFLSYWNRLKGLLQCLKGYTRAFFWTLFSFKYFKLLDLIFMCIKIERENKALLRRCKVSIGQDARNNNQINERECFNLNVIFFLSSLVLSLIWQLTTIFCNVA